MRLKIENVRVVDPGLLDAVSDVWIADGRILKIGPVEMDDSGWDEKIDGTGLVLAPGLVDSHVHLREPGQEYKEDIASGCAAAVAGGFTAVCCMPNTSPVNDNRAVTEFILSQAKRARLCKVYPAAAITTGLSGENITEIGELKEAGVVAITDDGVPVEDARMMRRAMEYATAFDLLVMSHSEEMSLARGGAMNEGETATRLGLSGIPNIAESLMVEREIALAEYVGARVHIAHVSTKESVRAIRDAKARGVKVTAETAPHYFVLTDEAVGDYDTHAKMNPPLRSEADRLAVIEGLQDGTLDCIATDHAPHSPQEKEVEFEQAPNGIIGLETSFGVSMKLVHDEKLAFSDLIRIMSKNPARILGLENDITEGAVADLVLIDPKREWTVDAKTFASKSRNCPFDGWTLKGKAVMTLVDGRIVFDQR